MSDEERSAVPGTTAHQANLRGLLDQQRNRIQEAAGDSGLTAEQRQLVADIIQTTLNEPTLSLATLIVTLEDLLSSPDLSTEAVYIVLEDHQSIALHRIAERAFAKGLQVATSAPVVNADPNGESQA